MSTDLISHPKRKSVFKILVALNAATLLAWIGLLVIGLGLSLENVAAAVWLFFFK
ncbi:hypothetical protein DYI24_06495 [Rhodopseudomonas sp. BR0C11]|uniref:hypothetical protein n=1 Tax=Rhodopseudomonas sp. BR0C11 TaxID=2269370 RepID=UPI0013DF2B63|nr:hypothetical protein [Rhodopseudomonas sp. BR0C11]NEV76691.1 hypothetical protein [Rhodopseudomonas sp. BR0C11]